MTETLKPIEEMSFEEAMSELEIVVRKLESGSIKLEDAVLVNDVISFYQLPALQLQVLLHLGASFFFFF